MASELEACKLPFLNFRAPDCPTWAARLWTQSTKHMDIIANIERQENFWPGNCTCYQQRHTWNICNPHVVGYGIKSPLLNRLAWIKFLYIHCIMLSFDDFKFIQPAKWLQFAGVMVGPLMRTQVCFLLSWNIEHVQTEKNIIASQTCNATI